MVEALQAISKVIPFLAPYSTWIKALVCLWLLHTVVIFGVLLFMRPETGPPEEGKSQQSASVHNSSNVNVNQAGRDVHIHNSAPPETKYTGVLLAPEGGTLPELQIGKGGPIFRIGDKDGQVFKFVTGSHMTVELVDGRLKVSTLIYDRTLKLAAELIRNEWKIAPPPAIWDRNYSDDALEVRDDRGEIVLQVRMAKERVQLQGIYYVKPDVGYAFIKNPQDTEAHILVFGPANPIWPHYQRIKPIFRYPSERHLGELVTSESPAKVG